MRLLKRLYFSPRPDSALQVFPGFFRPVLGAVNSAAGLAGQGLKRFSDWAQPVLAPVMRTRTGRYFADLVSKDVGFISATSLLLAAASLGFAPAIAIAGASVGAVMGLKAHQKGILGWPRDRINALFEGTRFEKFLTRPNAGYSLSSVLSGATTLAILGGMAAGALPLTMASAAVTVTGLAFAVSNNIKAARRDNVRPWLGLSRVFNYASSEKIAIAGNLARNWIAGPVAGAAASLVYLEGLKFSFRDSAGREANNRSYTDNNIAPLYGWKEPKSDDGMSRATMGVASGLAAVWAVATGNLYEAAALLYPTYAQFRLAVDGHKAYALQVERGEPHHLGVSDEFEPYGPDFSGIYAPS